MQNRGEELDYISSAESSQPQVDIVQQDEADLPVLRAIKRDNETRIASLNSNDSLSLEDKHFSIEQQLSNNQYLISYLRNHNLAIQDIEQNIKEKYSNG